MNSSNILFAPIRSKRSFEEVSAKIKNLILNGVLKPGDRLPPETELAHQFNVSRQTVREGLRMLELSGFITVQRGGKGGPLIKDTVLTTIKDLFLDAFQMEKISLEELTMARLEIEKVVLEHVIKNIEKQDIRRLEQNIMQARNKVENDIVAIKENIEFHNILAEASRNHVFVIVVKSILAVLKDLLTRLTMNPERSAELIGYRESLVKSKNAVGDHEKILSAILEKRDVDAKDLLQKHLLEVRNRLHAIAGHIESKANP
ncbi:MAG: FadR family transcriptional regulator [Deltaproteobacteria bacterium]|nr:FadR family transcriptional regulator [Deltaproteobacteria bacterium]